MFGETSSETVASNLLEAAGHIDLGAIAMPPAGLQLENLRRRGLDLVRVKWETRTRPSRSLLRLLGFGLRKAQPGVMDELTFVDHQIRFHAAAKATARSIEHVIAYEDVARIMLHGSSAAPQRAVTITTSRGSLAIGHGLPDDCLEWLRDRLVLEVAGLVWKPVFNVGKRTTKHTSNPDHEVYRRWRSSQHRLITLFLDQADAKMQTLQQSLASEAWAQVWHAAHWMKSSSAAVGASQLSELCQRLEIDIAARDVGRVRAVAPHILASYATVRATLRAMTGADAETGIQVLNSFNRLPPSAEPPEPLPVLPGINVLLVEDSHVNQEIARDCLERAGCAVIAVDSGEEAVQICQTHTFDAILMDCQLDGIDGFAATKLIRDHETRTRRPVRAPIIALTANALRDDRDICLAAGMNDYLSKPFIEADLIAAVARSLDPSACAAVLRAVLKAAAPSHACDDIEDQICRVKRAACG